MTPLPLIIRASQKWINHRSRLVIKPTRGFTGIHVLICQHGQMNSASFPPVICSGALHSFIIPDQTGHMTVTHAIAHRLNGNILKGGAQGYSRLWSGGGANEVKENVILSCCGRTRISIILTFHFVTVSEKGRRKKQNNLQTLPVA